MRFQCTDSMVKRITDTIGMPIYTFKRYMQSKEEKTPEVVGVPWYNEKSWKEMKALAEDKDQLHESYQKWLASADKSIVLMTNRGELFERLYIDPIHYTWWCKKKVFRRNRASRSLYTKYLLNKKIAQSHSR